MQSGDSCLCDAILPFCFLSAVLLLTVLEARSTSFHKNAVQGHLLKFTSFNNSVLIPSIPPRLNPRSDGFIYPDSLRVSSCPNDDRRLLHLVSDSVCDVSVLQLYRHLGDHGGSGSRGGGDDSGDTSGRTSRSSGSSRSEVSWPHLATESRSLVEGVSNSIQLPPTYFPWTYRSEIISCYCLHSTMRRRVFESFGLRRSFRA